MASSGYLAIPTTVDTAEEDAAYVKMEFGVVPPHRGFFNDAMCRRVKWVLAAVAFLAMVGAGVFQVRSNMGDGHMADELQALEGRMSGAEDVSRGLPGLQGSHSNVGGVGLQKELKVQGAPEMDAFPMPTGSNLEVEAVDAGAAGGGDKDADGGEKKKGGGGWGKATKKSKKKSMGDEVACPAAPPGVPAPSECLEWEGSTYYGMRAELTWDQAQLTCGNLGGHLTSVKSSKENQLVSDMFKGEVFWIGLRYDRDAKKWSWADGSETGKGDKWSKSLYTNWGHGKPAHEHHGLKADCVMGNYHLGATGAWADTYCSDVKKRKHPFVCKIALEEEAVEGGGAEGADAAAEGAGSNEGGEGGTARIEEAAPTNLSVAREL